MSNVRNPAAVAIVPATPTYHVPPTPMPLLPGMAVDPQKVGETVGAHSEAAAYVAGTVGVAMAVGTVKGVGGVFSGLGKAVGLLRPKAPQMSAEYVAACHAQWRANGWIQQTDGSWIHQTQVQR